jgi:HK97 family phage portal protein
LGIIQRIIGPFGLSIADAPKWKSLFAESNAAGKPVNTLTSMQLAAFWAGVRVQASAVGSIPLHAYRETGDNRERITDHPISDLVSNSPNADQTANEFWETITAWLCVAGNAYALIERNGSRIVALIPLPSDKVEVIRDVHNDLYYRFNDRGRAVEYRPDDILHFKGISFGGDEGISPIKIGAQVLGSALAAEESSAKFLGSGYMPSGVLKSQAELTDTQRDDLGKILQQYAGSERAGKVMVLEAGLDYQQISLDPQSVQLLETRRWSAEQILMMLGVPPIVVGLSGDGITAWGTGIEAISRQWLQTGLNPLLVRIERRIKKQLLGPSDRGVFFEFNREAWLQTDSASKIDFLARAVQNGLATRSEARRKLGFNDRPEADFLTAQTNLAPLDKLGAAQDARSAMRGALGLDNEQ